MIIAFESKESGVVCGDVSHSKAITPIECALECLEVKLASHFCISLPLLKVDSCNGCFDEARVYFLIKLLVDLSGSHTVGLHLLENCVLNENVNLALGRQQIRVLQFLLKLGSHQRGILELVLNEVCVSQPKLSIVFSLDARAHGSLVKQFRSSGLLLRYLEVDVFHPFPNLPFGTRIARHTLLKGQSLLNFALGDWEYGGFDVVDEVLLVSFEVVGD